MASENLRSYDDAFVLQNCSTPSLISLPKRHLPETIPSSKRRRYDDFLLQKCPIISAINDRGKFLAQSLYFFNKLQQISPTNHLTLLKSFWNYTSGLTDLTELQTDVTSLIGDNTQLMTHFSAFMKSADEIVPVISKDKTGIEKRVSGKRSFRVRKNPNVPVTEKFHVQDQRSRKEDEMWERWRDAMYEADMCIIWFKSAASFAEKVSAGIEERELQGMSRNHFFRCLEQLYRDYTDQILEIWHGNPVTASALVLTRLRQKLVDLTSFKEQLMGRVYRPGVGLVAREVPT
ncbi:hypothetical protein M5689_014565 [Euphorbia peplus]|nr:hypothetical protein M5689_014565 [Euphorbia peplus]